jgi:PAS domain S-box-containing protein
LKRVSKSVMESKPSRTNGHPAQAHLIGPRARRPESAARDTGRPSFESFFLELSAYFVKAPADQVERGIDIWLEKLARYTRVDRIGLWECNPDGVHVKLRHVYSDPGLPSGPPSPEEIDFPWINEQYRRGRVVNWARVPEDIPAEAVLEHAHSVRVGAKSVLALPVHAGTTVYVLALSSMRTYHKWPKSLVRKLQLVTEIFASTFVRLSAERSLIASEARNRAILKALPDLIFVLKPDGVFAECHYPATIDLLAPPDAFMGRPMEDVLPPETARHFRSAFRRAAETGEMIEIEYVLPIGGDERHFEGRVVRGDDGAMVVMVRNITERHRAATQLRESEQRFRVAFSHSAIGIALVSLEGNFLQVNGALCEILGYTAPELLSTKFQVMTHPDDLEANLRNWRRALAGEISHYEMEKRYIHKDGRVIWALLTTALVRNDLNEPLYFVSQLQDVSERKQAQMDIERARLELTHIGRVSLVGQLTTSLAHELLQPITAVVANAQTALRAPELAAPSEMRALIEDIAESGARAGEIIHNIRGLLRKEREPYTTVELNALVQEVAHVMRSDLLVHQVRLITHLHAGDAEINGDRGELQQVLLNLMLNATESMAETAVDARKLVIGTVVRADTVELSVQDSGTGAAPIDLKRLPEPFFTTKPGGVGMGLSICAEIVRAHKGQLVGENNPERGMTWRCLLPRG